MLPQSVFPYPPISLTTWVGDANSPFEGNLALGHRGALPLFGRRAPSCSTPQNLHWPWKTTSEILGAPESYLITGVVPKPVWSGALDLLRCGRDLVSTLDDQECLLKQDAEPTKFAHAPTQEILPREVIINKNATAFLQHGFRPTRKSPGLSPDSPRVEDGWTGQSEWLGILSAIKNFAGLTILEVARAKNSISTPFPNPSESALKFTRDRLTSSPKITKRGHGIGRLVGPSVKRIGAQQSFEIAPIKAASVHFEVLGGLDTMAPETRPVQNLGTEPTPGSSHSGSSMPLSTRPSVLIPSSTSPFKSRTTGHETVPSTEPTLPISTAHRSLGWPDYAANHLPSQHPNVVRPAKFLAHATTLSAQSRAKIGRQVRHQEP